MVIWWMASLDRPPSVTINSFYHLSNISHSSYIW